MSFKLSRLSLPLFLAACATSTESPVDDIPFAPDADEEQYALYGNPTIQKATPGPVNVPDWLKSYLPDNYTNAQGRRVLVYYRWFSWITGETCDGQDNNGNGRIDEFYRDADGDGIRDCVDIEVCDGVDNDGDRIVDEGGDADGDGIGDCFDVETCDGVDNNANGQIDEGFDFDGDGIANCFDTEECDGADNDGDGSTDEGFDVDADGIADCFDTETCDGIDNDGDGIADEGFDADGDGLSDCFDVEECDGLDNDGDGSTDEGFDNDGDGLANCFDSEECDGLDNNGDGATDEGFDNDGDGLANCFDVEECDGLDNDGDGATDEGFDNDGDGLANCFDVEECDGLDNDGDGGTDEGFDNDGDGLANCFDSEECDGFDNDGDGATDEGFDVDGDGTADCFDSEECDGVDNDGDGAVDEDFGDADADGTADCLDSEECDGVDNDGDGVADNGFDGLIWQLGTFDGAVDPIAGSAEYPANDGYAPLFTYVITGTGSATPAMPGLLGDRPMSQIDPNRRLADAAGTIDLIFEADDYLEAATLTFGRYGSETTGIVLDFDGNAVTTIDGPGEGAYGVYEIFLGPVTPGLHTLSLVYLGGGSSNGHYIDALRLDAASCFLGEVCNGLDDNGDGSTDEVFPDTDGDGTADCVDTETCDGVDNDGDGTTDEGFGDADADGIADCLDTETCDGLDNDGDGSVDEDFDANGNGTGDCFEVLPYNVSIASTPDGSTTLEDGRGAVATYSGNERWTASLPGATWLWDAYYEGSPGAGRTVTFYRGFSLPEGLIGGSASLSVAADNSYTVWLNGQLVAEDASETNYFAADTWSIGSALQPGENELVIEVWNWAQAGGTAQSNPGGVLYALSFDLDAQPTFEVCNGADDDFDGVIDDQCN